MAVTVAGAVENLRTGTTDPWTWSHNSGTTSPQGVVVMVMHGTSSTDHVVSVTYGTRSLTRVQRNVDTATEAGAAEIWFAGGGIPTGTQTVSVDLASATTDDLHGVSVTLDADFDLVKLSNGGVDENVANPSVNLTNAPGNSAMAFAALYSGQTAISALAAGTDCTFFTTSELAGNFCSGGFRQTTASTGNFTIAATVSTDDVAFAAATFGESVIAAASGSYTITGTAVGLKVKLNAAIGSYAITGASAGLHIKLAAGSGSYSISGQTSDFRYHHLNADSGTYAIVGSPSSLAYVLAAAVGVYSLTGTAADLIKAGGGHTLAVDSGVYTLTGTAAALNVGLNAGIGSYTITGTAAALRVELNAAIGIYTLTGTAATLRATRLLNGEFGTYVLSGSNVTLIQTIRLHLDVGSYSISGEAATLVYSGSGAPTTALTLAMMGFGR